MFIEQWDGGYLIAGSIAATLILVSLLFLLSYFIYENRRRTRQRTSVYSSGEEGDQCANGGVLRDAQKGVPASLRFVQSLAKMHSRILDDYQDSLLVPETCGVIDQFNHLTITSVDFDRSYSMILAKYKRSDSLRGLAFSFSIGSLTGGGILHNSTIHPYADALLTGPDGLLKLYRANDRSSAVLSANWIFNTTSPDQGPWRPFGRINTGSGRTKYHLKVATEKKKKRRQYALMDEKTSTELLLIKGRPQMVTWAASYAGMSKTSLVFKVYAKRNEGEEKVQIATIEPTIEVIGVAEENQTTLSMDEVGQRVRPKVFTRSYGDQLYSIKYNKAYVIDPEMKTAILGVAFLLCLRHYMKDLYRIFQRASLGKG